ncbi:hypothetical protein ACFQH3_10300 [Haladaptatus sp. GCM10025707]|uniref:AMP-binding enzyme n=1 Tax=Haladaptatus sp. GCM10025707 TaxID=3252658 RepID=UPI00361BB569
MPPRNRGGARNPRGRLERRRYRRPRRLLGEKVVAVVEPRPDADVDEATLASQLEATCEAELAAYKKPKRIDIVDELPRSSYGKVRKTDLREEYWDDAERNVN